MQNQDRLVDLAQKAHKHGFAHSAFVSEEALAPAMHIAKQEDLLCKAFGGYPDAERQVLCFYHKDEEAAHPIACFGIESKVALEHRQILGSILALGLKRDVLGDIVLSDFGAYVFCLESMAQHIADSLLQVGRQSVQCKVFDTLPEISTIAGQEQRFTVASPRLDAVLGAVLHLSRGDASALIAQSKVYLNHALQSKADKQVQVGDKLSIRGFGRCKLLQIGTPTKKNRIPIVVEQFLKNKKKF
ncbi:MAG: YlmH/Sll1252 family protein [Eubacteriales bacterium]|nr:YlmH/Sll1252 family protein [Eubacteriales bacterium]